MTVSFLTSISPIAQHTVGVIGAAGGAIIARIFEHWLNSDEKLSAENVYDDLRKDVKRLQQENDSLKDDVIKSRKDADKWRSKYWSEIESRAASTQEIASDLEDIKKLFSDDKKE